MNRISFSLFATTIFISLLGLFILYETSSYSAVVNIGDPYFFVKYQAIWIAFGILAAIVISRIDYRRFYYLALPLLLVSYFLLFLVFFPGIGLKLKGASRWLDFHWFIFQPSEFLKISLTLYLAAWFSGREKGISLAFLILFLSAVLLVAVEPDLGTAGIVASVSFALYFLSGARWREVLGILFLLLALVVFLIKIEPYRLQRFSGFASFNPGNLNQAPYHIRQVLIALGSGGLTGVGIGRSTQKYAYVPENTTDSIFAMWAEETGFLGSMFLLLLFLLQLFTSFLVGLRAQSRFGKLLVFGIAIFLSFQTLLNLASQVALVPLTGIPLPFVSYGGSSMVINFSAIGIVMSIANRDLV